MTLSCCKLTEMNDDYVDVILLSHTKASYTALTHHTSTNSREVCHQPVWSIPGDSGLAALALPWCYIIKRKRLCHALSDPSGYGPSLTSSETANKEHLTSQFLQGNRRDSRRCCHNRKRGATAIKVPGRKELNIGSAACV